MTLENKKKLTSDYYNTGLTLLEIAEKYQVKKGNIHNILKEVGKIGVNPLRPASKKSESFIMVIDGKKNMEHAAMILNEYGVDFLIPDKFETTVEVQSSIN